jgi:CRISPR-associated protein Cas1
LSYLYITDQGARISIKDNQIIIENIEGISKSVPVEVVEGIFIFGNVNLTTPFIQEMLQKIIPVTFLSSTGSYFGKLESTANTNIIKQGHQFKILYDAAFCMEFSRKIIAAKVNNQLVILRRYGRTRQDEKIEQAIEHMTILKHQIDSTTDSNELMGYEGMIARHYFAALGRIVPKPFYFEGRSKQPPKDPFNSLLSLGYTMFMYEIYNVIVASGLSPYLGIFHKPRNQHPTLASDLIEEWRAVVIDSLCLNLLSRNMITLDDFEIAKDTHAVYIDKAAIKKFLTYYEQKIRTENEYMKVPNGERSDYRACLHMQVKNYYKAIQAKNPDLYQPIILR